MPWTARHPLRLPLLLSLGCVAVIAACAWLLLRERVPPGTPDDARAEQRWMPAERSNRWTCIVLHHSASTAGGADRFDEYHRTKGWDELGYHFVIGNGTDTADGQVEVGPRWAAQKHGAHCRTDDDYFNQHGIGVCLVGNFDLRAPDEAQMRSLRRLIAFLAREFRIPPEHVYTHGEVTGQTKCPGKHFDVEAVKREMPASPLAAAARE